MTIHKMVEQGEEHSRNGLVPRLKSSAAAPPPPPRPSNLPASNATPGRPQYRAAAAKRPGIPPAHPNGIPYYLPVPHSASSRTPSSHHSRALSQQPAFFNLDSNASNAASPADPPPVDDRDLPRLVRSRSDRPPADELRPLKIHRRSQSDIPYGFLSASPPIMPPPAAPVNQEWERDGSDEDDLFNAYLNLDGLDPLNSSEDRREELDGRASGSKRNARADSSETESESSSDNESGSRGRPHKRIAIGDPLPIAARHRRSVSMDSFMEKTNFGEEPPMLPPSSQLEFVNGEFNPAEIEKIMANEKLADIAIDDPKRAKRILANRKSAARSKERKMRYISQLEQKVKTLQTETTTVSAQLTMIKRDSVKLTVQKNEMQFRIDSMAQQDLLRDALFEALNAEVHRLKLKEAQMGETHLSNSLNQQINLNSQVLQRQELQNQQQQSTQMPLYQLQQQNNYVSKNQYNK